MCRDQRKGTETKGVVSIQPETWNKKERKGVWDPMEDRSTYYCMGSRHSPSKKRVAKEVPLETA